MSTSGQCQPGLVFPYSVHMVAYYIEHLVPFSVPIWFQATTHTGLYGPHAFTSFWFIRRRIAWGTVSCCLLLAYVAHCQVIHMANTWCERCQGPHLSGIWQPLETKQKKTRHLDPCPCLGCCSSWHDMPGMHAVCAAHMSLGRLACIFQATGCALKATNQCWVASLFESQLKMCTCTAGTCPPQPLPSPLQLVWQQSIQRSPDRERINQSPLLCNRHFAEKTAM